METNLLERKFNAIGARLKLREFPAQATSRDRWSVDRNAKHVLRIDVRSDNKGEYFDILTNAATGLEVVDQRAEQRHLVLLSRQETQKDKYLCGHDERHWFVAALPQNRPVTTVTTAMEALKPLQIVKAQAELKVRFDKRNQRRNQAFVRQGEWFFSPAPEMAKAISPKHVWSNEPLTRGAGSKPHRCQFLYRDLGETVYVCEKHPRGLLENEYRKVLRQNTKASKWNWRVMRRNADVYVRGTVSHPDHATICLIDWHRVVMNTENESRARSFLTFLD